jgi:hypothetical protein
MSDRFTRERVQPQSSIRALLDEPSVVASRENWEMTEDRLGHDSFDPTSSAYRAHAKPASLMLPSVHFIFRDRSIRTCQYYQLESDSGFTTLPQGKGNRLVFHFAGSSNVEVVIQGRNLWKLYDSLTQHRIAWVHELPADRDFETDGATVVHTIAIESGDAES